MTIQLNTVIDRPITDARHFTSTMLAPSAVRNLWTLIKSKSYPDPDGGVRLPPRKGFATLKNPITSANWITRGGFEVPVFAGATTGNFEATIVSPTNLFSIVEICRPDEGFTESWGLNYGPLTIYGIPNRNNRHSVQVPGQAATAMAVSPALGSWQLLMTVVDLNAATAKSAVNGGGFTVPAAFAGAAPQTATNSTLLIGAGAPAQNFVGAISDLSVIGGDISTMPALVASWMDYFTTAYTG